MHFRNGREAKNGDIVVPIDHTGRPKGVGVLYDAIPEHGDYCNGSIAPLRPAAETACLIDCLHIDDVRAALAAQGLDKRPPGK